MKITIKPRDWNVIGIFFHNFFQYFVPAPRIKEYPWEATKRELQAKIFIRVLDHFDGWTENTYMWLGAPIEKWNTKYIPEYTPMVMMQSNPELLNQELGSLLKEEPKT